MVLFLSGTFLFNFIVRPLIILYLLVVSLLLDILYVCCQWQIKVQCWRRSSFKFSVMMITNAKCIFSLVVKCTCLFVATESIKFISVISFTLVIMTILLHPLLFWTNVVSVNINQASVVFFWQLYCEQGTNKEICICWTTTILHTVYLRYVRVRCCRSWHKKMPILERI